MSLRTATDAAEVECGWECVVKRTVQERAAEVEFDAETPDDAVE